MWHDTAIPFKDVLHEFELWMKKHHLWVKEQGGLLNRAAFVTWLVVIMNNCMSSLASCYGFVFLSLSLLVESARIFALYYLDLTPPAGIPSASLVNKCFIISFVQIIHVGHTQFLYLLLLC